MKLLITILLVVTTSSVYGQSFDSCAYYKRKLDTVNHKLYIATKQINTAKFYIAICKKKPSNKKFFYGWITQRAIK
jgi:hypothetical protein